MSQHDYNLANQNGAAFRADLNAALEAIQSVNSGATEPASTVAYMPWADTNSGLWKVRNAADSAWVSVISLTASRVDTAAGTSYDNSGSDLSAGTVQEAIDELETSSLTNIGTGTRWANTSGTADAIVLTTATGHPIPSLVNGAQFRFKASSVNTGPATINIDGTGAKPVLTITGAALPATYIREFPETVIRYDSTSDSFIADRQPERGSNANGDYLRMANGILTCRVTADTSASADSTWTFPVPFAGATTTIGLSISAFTASTDAIPSYTTALTTTQAGYRGINRDTGARLAFGVRLMAEGYWY